MDEGYPKRNLVALYDQVVGKLARGGHEAPGSFDEFIGQIANGPTGEVFVVGLIAYSQASFCTNREQELCSEPAWS